MTKIADQIREVFKDDRFDIVQIAGAFFDREDFVDVTSTVQGADEMLHIEMKNGEMSFYASSVRLVYKMGSTYRQLFKQLVDDESVETVKVEYNRSSGNEPTVIRRKDVMTLHKRGAEGLVMLVESSTGFNTIDFKDVVAVSATRHD